MQWLNKIVDEVIASHPEGEIIVSSGVSPSGTYHLGTLREVLTTEVIMRELKRRGRASRHLHIVDDLDVFRKVPADVDDDFSKYLGKPLCDVPAPDGSDRSYADFFLADLLSAAAELKLEMEIIRSHQKYRSGFFIPAIEQSLRNVPRIKEILSDVSGRKLDEQWSPVQIIEDGYLKNRQFDSLNETQKTITYKDNNGNKQTIDYTNGDVKLNWRVDWPARWWLLGVNVEPFGRDHATKGGSYDTGAVIVTDVFGAEPPLPVPYNFINRTGDTKKMSKSAGTSITAAELLHILPPEIVWYFLLRYSPDKQLFFDQGDTLMRLFDEFAELLAKTDKTPSEQQLLALCLYEIDSPTVSNVSFSHLVASYQAALRDPAKTIEVISRTQQGVMPDEQTNLIKKELNFIEQWLKKWAPEDIKFELVHSVDPNKFEAMEKKFLSDLADKISSAPENADGEWYHKAIYEFKETSGLASNELFLALYKVLIGKPQGPRAGWFLSILPREWLINRLRLEA